MCVLYVFFKCVMLYVGWRLSHQNAQNALSQTNNIKGYIIAGFGDIVFDKYCNTICKIDR